MNKLILGCFLISGFAVAETSVSENKIPETKETKTRLCPPEDAFFISITTSCGEPAVATGCTTAEIVADTIQWEVFYYGPLAPPVV
jgi:hypothetical protein